MQGPMSEQFIEIRGLDQFKRAAVVLKEAAGTGITGEVKKNLYAELRAAGRPAVLAIREAYGQRMPQRGGLAEKLSKAQVGVRSRISGPSVVTSLVTRVPGYDLTKIEEGDLRHPVFGNRKTWVSQEVPAHVAGEAFDAIAAEIDVRVNVALDKVIATVEARI